MSCCPLRNLTPNQVIPTRYATIIPTSTQLIRIRPSSHPLSTQIARYYAPCRSRVKQSPPPLSSQFFLLTLASQLLTISLPFPPDNGKRTTDNGCLTTSFSASMAAAPRPKPSCSTQRATSSP